MTGLFNLSALAVRERAVTLFLILLAISAGLYAFLSLGRSEDPAFTVKVMVVTATWPGASARQMQQQVADRLEKRIREVDYFYRTQTTARPGRVDILVEFRDYTPASKLADLFYQVRKRMQEEAPRLPPGVQGPFVNDDFSDVYFTLYSLRAPGLPPRLLTREAEAIRDQLVRIEGVQKVNLIGERPERVLVEFDNSRISTLGLRQEDVYDAIDAFNRLLPAGQLETRGPRVYLRLNSGFDNLDSIRALPIRAGNRLVSLGEIAQVRRGYEDPPAYLVRAWGEDAMLLGVVMRRGENGLELGQRLATFEAAQAAQLPAGIRLDKLTNQADAVSHAVEIFQTKFVVAVGVVMLVSFLALGIRAGIVVAIAIPLTLALSFLLMKINGINLDRITLGALIIALGLLVDDAIIAIEMMLVKMEEGWDRVLAASHAWTVTAAPMLAGTLVTAAGFVPIGFAHSSVGEYAGNIFWVLAFALLMSWLVAVVFTPYLGVKLLPDVAREGHRDSPYSSALYRRLRKIIAACVDSRKTVVAVTFAILLLAIFGLAKLVPKQFFPSSDRPEVLIDIYLPEGSSIAYTDSVTRRLEKALRGMPQVRTLSSYVGAGAPRFFLALNPELPNPAFAKIVAVTKNADERNQVIEALQRRIAAGEYPEARIRVHGLVFGPPVVWPVSFRVVGPDPVRLRQIAEQVRTVAAANIHAVDPHLEWGDRVLVAKLNLDLDRLRLIGLTPRELAMQLQFQLQGLPVTQVREDIRSVQLRVRGLKQSNSPRLGDLYLKTLDNQSVPLSQLGKIEYEFEDPVLKRYNGEPFIAVNAEVKDAQPPDVSRAIQAQLEQIRKQLPAGYHIDIGGSVEESAKGDASIQKVMPVMVALMLLFIMLQMRSFVGTFMVLFTAPLGIIGAVPALLIGGKPFGFVALLGLIGLAGILMRNTLILAGQVAENFELGMNPAEAVIEATVRRARPVLLTALAAMLAFVPLASDTFWGPLADVLIGGVLAGTVITLLFLPALYALWFRLPSGAASDPAS